MTRQFSHLDLLEAESIHIFREAAAQFRKPVLMYSIGKDSTVLLHLARKAFWPAEAAVPAAAHRHDVEVPRHDRLPRQDGARASASSSSCTPTRKAWRRGINPIDHSPSVYTDVMKTQAAEAGARQARLRRGLRRRAARRGEPRAPRSACSRSARPGHRWDPRRQRPEMWHLLNGRLGTGETVRVFPLSNWTEHDVWRYIAPREASTSCRSTSPPSRPTITRNGQLLVVDDDRMPLQPGEVPQMKQRALPHARLLAADCRRAVDGSRPRKRRRRDARRAHVRAAGPPHRPRSSRRHGAQEARGLLLMTALTAHPARSARRLRSASAPINGCRCTCCSPAARSTTASRR